MLKSFLLLLFSSCVLQRGLYRQDVVTLRTKLLVMLHRTVMVAAVDSQSRSIPGHVGQVVHTLTRGG